MPLLTCLSAQQNGLKSYPKLHLPLETLQDLFSQQLRVELSANVSVQSVDKAPEMTKEVIEAVRASPSPGPGRSWQETLAQVVTLLSRSGRH